MSKSDPPSRPALGRWLLRHDGADCGTCEVCARHCPTGALRIERSDGTLRLLFRPALCDGCGEGEGCEAICTEKAITRVEDPTAAAEVEEMLLIESPLVTCTTCGESFATNRKLSAVLRRREGESTVQRELCPLCRRENLVVRFIEDKRVPGSTAEYRSARDILRRAGYGTGKRKPP